MGKALLYKQILLTNSCRKCMELSLESLYLDTGFKGLINSKSNLHVCDHLQYSRITPKKFSQSKHLKKTSDSVIQTIRFSCWVSNYACFHLPNGQLGPSDRSSSNQNHEQKPWDTFVFLGRFPIHTGPTPPLTSQTMLDTCVKHFFRVSPLYRVGQVQENFENDALL